MDRLVAWVSRWPTTIVLTTALIATACALLSWRYLRLDADTNSLIGDQQPFMEGYRAFQRNFGDLEYLLVVVDPKGHEREADAAVRELVDGLRAVPDVPGVMGFVDAAEQFRVSTWAMPDTTLRELHLARGALPELASRPGGGGLLKASAERVERLLKEGGDMQDAARR